MGRIVVGTFVTVDGIMQAPGGPDEDREGGFEHGGWFAPYVGEEEGSRYMDGFIARWDALLLGRKTYEIFAGFWPNQPDDNPTAAKLNTVPKYVASRTLQSADWHNTTLLEGDAAQAVAKLKDELDGELHVSGSGDLVQTLLRNDIVDELVLLVSPVVLGTGKRLFGDGTIPARLRLVDSRSFASGIVIQVYERAGELEYGTIGG